MPNFLPWFFIPCDPSPLELGSVDYILFLCVSQAKAHLGFWGADPIPTNQGPFPLVSVFAPQKFPLDAPDFLKNHF